MILRLLILATLLYGSIPYYSLYRLNHALVVNDTAQLNRYIDLNQVRVAYKQSLQIDQQGQEGAFSKMFLGTANTMSALTVDQMVSIEWIRQKLTGASQEQIGSSMFDQLDHAFFEGPNTFLVRLGALSGDPLHLILERQGLVWRLSALHS